ncbi:hypothetical protein ACFXB3_27320 [Streptomyces sp. NPDC059447]|uniref:hypothetical protein n=1 Tax=Streptomyces sp. NPDC059447 TaxID=3346834 RepID=UPI003688977A
MSTPEEQQQPQHPNPQQPHPQQEPAPDPYGTQTWQADTWDTGYQPVQPVQPPLGAVPGQPVAPEGWFRDEPQAGAAGEAPAPAGGVPWPGAPGAEGYPSYPAQQAQEPQVGGSWSDGSGAVPAAEAYPSYPAQQAQEPQVGGSWSDGSGAVPAAEAYPSYPAQQAQEPQAGGPWPDGSGTGAGAEAYQQYQQAQQAQAGQPVAPEGWFRDEVQAPAPAAPAPAAETPYLPQHAAPAASAAETAYLPPYPGPEAQAAAPQAAVPASAAETAYLPPYPGPQAEAARPAEAGAAEQTAFLPPYQADPGVEAQSAVPEGWFRDEVAAPAPAQDWSQGAGTAVSAAETAYLPPYPGPAGPSEQAEPESAAEQTAFLPPQTAAPATAAAPAAAPTAEPAAGGAAEDSAWSPPTLGGNTLRAVDPAQARAEGRSPIIDPGPQSAILTAALGLLMALAAFLGQYAVLVPLVALQALTAAGWFRLNGMWPARQGIALAFAGGLVADAAVLAVDDSYGPGAIIGTLGAWVLITLVLQLRSHADPDERMYGLMASVASAALAIVCAGWLAADTAAVSVGAVAVAVAAFTRALPLPTAPSVGVALASAAGSGLVVGGLTDVGVGGALVGLAAGVCALIGLRVAAYDYPSKFVHMTAGVALPLAVAAPAVYLIGRVVS